MNGGQEEIVRIAVDNRGKKKFQFGDGPVFEVDVFEASFRIQEIINMFPGDEELCRRFDAYRELIRKYEGGEATNGEIYHFLNYIDVYSGEVKKNLEERLSSLKSTASTPCG